MLDPISIAAQTHAAAQPAAASTNPAVQPKVSAAVTPSDSVQISAAARALQEATETPAQTAKEAAAGDLQAKHLLAKEAAEKSNL